MRRFVAVAVAMLIPLSVSGQLNVFDTYTPDPCSPNGQPTGRCDDPVLRRVRLAPVAVALDDPRHIAMLPDGDILVAEFENLRLIDDGILESEPIAAWPGELPGAGNLHSVIVHPRFGENRLVYMWYAKHRGRDREDVTMALARARLDGMALAGLEEIFEADAWSDDGGPLAGRAAFGPDGMIYATINDQDPFNAVGEARIRMRVQELDNDSGKILRIRDDGSIPDDNPFVGVDGANPQIFSIGHRNVTGLAWHPETDALWAPEIGPMGGDELNVVQAGNNYGWPLVSLGILYNQEMVSDQPWYRPGMQMPVMWWSPSISPTGAIFYTGDVYPYWRGHLFLGALNGQMLQRVAFDQPMPQQQRRESLFIDFNARFRDVAESPDGYIYVLTEQRGIERSGAVYRIEPVH